MNMIIFSISLNLLINSDIKNYILELLEKCVKKSHIFELCSLSSISTLVRVAILKVVLNSQNFQWVSLWF